MAERKAIYNQAQNRATQAFLNKNREQVRFWVRKGEMSVLRDTAKANGQSMAAYIIDAINEKAGQQILTPSEGRCNSSADPGTEQ